MAKSKTTKHNKTAYIICSIVSFLLSWAPILIYGLVSFGVGETTEKLVLSFGFLSAIVLAVLSFLTKMRFKSALWVILVGISFALSNIQTMLIIVAVCSLLDELVMEPLAKKFKNRYIINAEIDKRS